MNGCDGSAGGRVLKIVWDERKRLENLAKHGLDFADLNDAFFEAAVILPAKLKRKMAIGKLQDDVVVAVFFGLGVEGISLILLRPASRKERTFR